MSKASIPELTAQKQKVQQVFSKVDAALHAGKITKEERDALLQQYYGTSDERQTLAGINEQIAALRQAGSDGKTVVLVSTFVLVMMTLFTVLLYSTGGITGAVVLDRHVNTTYFTNATIPLELSSTTRINVTGQLQGEGEVQLVLAAENQTLLLLNWSSSTRTAHAFLPKQAYREGEQVVFTAEHLSAAYLMTDTQALLLENTTLENLTAGSYSIKLIINDSELLQETLPFIVVGADDPIPATTFNKCGEACSVNITGNASLQIIMSGNVTITIGSIIIFTGANSAPQLVHNIPDVTAAGTARIEMGGAFADPDGDQLYYESSHHEGMTEEIEQGTLSVSGEPGTYTYIVYASDQHELTPSNIFSITITALSTNATYNSTTPENITNITPANLTSNAPIINTTYEPGCTDPDPNRRPLSCIQGNESTYFRPEEILLENKAAYTVGQLTPVGNLLIRGGLVERSTRQPGSADYAIGYADENGEFIATIWIDSTTGDLHLRGTLTEANGNIPIESGLSAIANRRGIVLALINRHTGDLIVRGNLVPYRRSIG